jgi:hypothetical protein
MRVIGFLRKWPDCVLGCSAGARGRVHSWIRRIWPNSGMRVELALRTVLACIWTCEGNQTGTNCTAGAWIMGYANMQATKQTHNAYIVKL